MRATVGPLDNHVMLTWRIEPLANAEHNPEFTGTGVSSLLLAHLLEGGLAAIAMSMRSPF